jgi:hypothetical protein
MHLICVPGSQFHTYDRLMSVISQDIAQNVQKRFINFYYTHDRRHKGLYTNNDNYEDATLLGGFGIEPSHTQRVENSYAKDAGGKTSEAVDCTSTF